MGNCPIQFWLPAMVIIAPFVRVIRDRFRAFLTSRRAPEPEVPREVKRWAPVGQPVTGDAAESAR